MSTTSALMTVEEFSKLKNPPGFYLELHNGQVVQMSYPKMKHLRIQERMRQIFAEAFGDRGIAQIEFAFRPKPEHELWQADVAWLPWERYEQVDDDDNLAGAPDIVVEVLSPSNTASEILEKKLMCMDNGCGEFWVVDPRKRVIEITRPGQTFTHRSGESLTVGAKEYAVDDILEGARSR
jgi:Uma2 family endonuclease